MSRKQSAADFLQQRGKRRIHKKPSYGEIGACFPWLEAEVEIVRPIVIVCLGATAAQALLGRHFRVTRDRGRVFQHELAAHVMATVHPSAILRAPTDEERHAEMHDFVTDLGVIASLLPHSLVAAR